MRSLELKLAQDEGEDDKRRRITIPGDDERPRRRRQKPAVRIGQEYPPANHMTRDAYYT